MEFMQNQNATRGFINLENRLAETLKPVHPNQAFLDTLKGKLAQSSTTILERRSSHQELMFIGVGLAFGALIVWLINHLKR